MTGALSGAALGRDAIPPAWVAAVEGTDRMRALADDLLALTLALGSPTGINRMTLPAARSVAPPPDGAWRADYSEER